MPDSDHVPPFVEALVRAVAGGSPEDRDERASTFARGLALGALVGAAIAGSTIWQRRHARMAALDAVNDAPVGAASASEGAVGD